MAIQNDLQNAELGYILCPFESYTNINGKPLVGGWITLYEAGTDTKYISYQDWQGAFNPFKIPIPADGRVVALGDPTKTYDAYLYNSFGDLVCSRLNLECNVAGNISIKGADTRIKNTDGTLDVSLRTLGNNVREYTVNTRNKILDCQSPLYFVENSNTATVIGFSGDNYATTADLASKMDISKLEYNEDGEISAYDGSAFAGQGAGDPEVNELVHSNSATWNNVSAKLDTTAFSTVSGNFLTAIPDDYATKDYVQSSVSSKLDSTAFSTVSGSFLTAHQDLSDYLTKESADGLYYPLNSNPSGYLTAHQSLADYLTKASADTLYQPKGDYATHDDLTAYQTVEGMTAYQPSGNYADATALDGKVDTSSFTAFSSTTNEKIEYISGALSGTYELSAGDGIDITDYPNEQKTVISVTAQGGNPEVENLVIANSATWDSVTGKADATTLNDYATTSQLADKLDTTAFSTVSGNFLTAHQSLEGYLQDTDLNTLDGKLTAISGVPLSAGNVTTKNNTFTVLPNTEGSAVTLIYPTTSYAGGESSFDPATVTTGKISWQDSLILLTDENGIDLEGQTISVTRTAVSMPGQVNVFYAGGNYNDIVYNAITGDGALVPLGQTGTFTATLRAPDTATTYTAFGLQIYEDAIPDFTEIKLIDPNVTPSYQVVIPDNSALMYASAMTAYQEAGNYLSASESTAFYPATSNPSGYLTAVPNTYLQNTDLSAVDGKIVEISGMPLSAGSESNVTTENGSFTIAPNTAGLPVTVTYQTQSAPVEHEATILNSETTAVIPGHYLYAHLTLSSNPNGIVTTDDMIISVTFPDNAFSGGSFVRAKKADGTWTDVISDYGNYLGGVGQQSQALPAGTYSSRFINFSDPEFTSLVLTFPVFNGITTANITQADLYKAGQLTGYNVEIPVAPVLTFRTIGE